MRPGAGVGARDGTFIIFVGRVRSLWRKAVKTSPQPEPEPGQGSNGLTGACRSLPSFPRSPLRAIA